MSTPKRTAGLTVIIILLALANIAGIGKLLWNKTAFLEAYSHLPAAWYYWLLAIPLLSLVSLLAVWFGKKWGILLAAVLFLVVLYLDISSRVWPHAAAATAGFALLLFFCWQSRRFFTG